MEKRKKGDPKVSVIIPTYNYARFLPESVESVLGQTFRDFELIIVDDGSTDDTGDVARSFLRDPRVKFVRQVNEGPSSARNRGIRIARGDYIAFLDSDDIWLPAKLERQMKMFEESDGIVLVHCMAENIDERGNILSRWSGASQQDKSYKKMLYMNWIVNSTVMMRKDIFGEVGLFDEELRGQEDLNMWLRILRRYKIAYIDDVLARYRVHKSSQSDVRNMEYNFLSHIQKSIAFFPELKEFEEEAIYHVYEGLTFLSYMHGKKMEIPRYYMKACRYQPSFFYMGVFRFLKHKLKNTFRRIYRV